MATRCFASVKGLMMRVTRLDACGAPVAPPCNAVVSKGFVTIGVSANVEDGETYQLKLADGSYAINDQDFPTITNFGLEMTFAQVDPDIFEMTAGAQVLTDYAGDNVGVAFDDTPQDQIFSLEVWTKVPGNACESGQQEGIYWLLPQVVNVVVGDFSIENSLANFSIRSQTRTGNGWGVGIYDVVPINIGNTPGPLDDPVPVNVHLLGRRTTIAPPSGELCGCQDITLPGP